VRNEIAVLVFVVGLVLAGMSMIRMHRANIVLAADTKHCATDAELVDLLRHPPPGGWESQGREQ
jgi:hypothetical protein